MVISNEKLSSLIAFKLKKNNNNFSYDELAQIETLTIDFKLSEDDFECLEFLKGLNELELIRQEISLHKGQSLLRLANIKRLVFDRCDFESIDFLREIKATNLKFICIDEEYDFLGNLKGLNKLGIIGCSIFDLKIIHTNQNISSLSLSNSFIVNIELLKEMKWIRELAIDAANINDFSFLLGFASLSRLSTSKDQIDSNIKVITKLQAKGVDIYLDNVVRW